jgi:AraC-like DNA-binding protein
MYILSILILLGSIQGIILAIVFLLKKNGIPSKVLGRVLATISVALFLAFLQLNIDFRDYPYLIKTTLPLSLIFMPFLYIYLLLVTGSIQNISKLQLKYFIPLAAILIYNLPFYFGDAGQKIEYFTRVELNSNQFISDKLEDIFVNSVVFVFSILAFIEAKNYKKRAMFVFSDFHKARIKWVQFLAFAMLFLSSTALVLLVVQLIFPDDFFLFFNFLTAIGSTIVIYFIGYYTLIYPEVFSTISSEISVLTEHQIVEDSKEEDASIYQSLSIKINTLLTEEKLYRNPELTLSELSKKTDIPAYLISKIISSSMQTNFYNLINKYRVDEVKNELLAKRGRGIMEIAYHSGFNTKSTFYEVFKKSTGFSPSEFIKQNQPE